jgi:HPt (histidine-containing phosphotransfer) domain-containing protein
MNIEQIADILEFEIEDVEMLLDMFLTDAKESMEGISSTIESNDFEQIKNIAHGIKGSASNLLLDEISKLALEIEQLAKTKSIADYQSMFEKLENRLCIIEEIRVPS